MDDTTYSINNTDNNTTDNNTDNNNTHAINNTNNNQIITPTQKLSLVWSGFFGAMSTCGGFLFGRITEKGNYHPILYLSS